MSMLPAELRKSLAALQVALDDLLAVLRAGYSLDSANVTGVLTALRDVARDLLKL